MGELGVGYKPTLRVSSIQSRMSRQTCGHNQSMQLKSKLKDAEITDELPFFHPEERRDQLGDFFR